MFGPFFLPKHPDTQKATNPDRNSTTGLGMGQGFKVLLE